MTRTKTYLQFLPVTVVGLVAVLVAALAGPHDGVARRAGTIEGFRLAAANPTAIYLDVSGFTGGESTAEVHPGLGEALSVASGLAGNGASKATASSIAITRYVDSYTTQFETRLVKGTNTKTVTIYLTRDVSVPIDVAKYVLTDVRVRSDQLSFNSDGAGTEHVTLDARKIALTYTVQKQDGSAGTPRTFCWDFAANAAC
jgi:type VI protein secretion system component Hcp